MEELERERRSPTDDEARIVRARGARREEALRRHAGPSVDGLVVALFGLGLAIGVGVVGAGFGRWMLVVFGVGLALLGALAYLRARRAAAARLAAEAEKTAARLAEVSDVRLEARRVVAVSDPHGEGETYWVCELASGRHAVLAGEMWDAAEAPPEAWREHVRLTLDGWGEVITMSLEGAPIEVDRRDVRAPDFEVTDAHLFWEPLPDGGLPCVVERFDPRPLGELDDV